jgi:hypothetical protein
LKPVGILGRREGSKGSDGNEANPCREPCISEETGTGDIKQEMALHDSILC